MVFMFLLQFFTVAVGLSVVVLLAAVLVGIWDSIRGDRIKKIERERERDQAANTH